MAKRFFSIQDPVEALRQLLVDVDAGRAHIARWAHPSARLPLGTEDVIEWAVDFAVVYRVEEPDA